MAKNGLKMGKKALCLIFAFLLSIESFGAVVADNDGASFITKAEFDSMKNDFQNTLNSFNSSIDIKIDNVISSYITGIKQTKSKFENIINYKWEEVTATNKAFANTYKVPSIDLSFQLSTRYRNGSYVNWDASTFWYFLDHYARLTYNETWNTTKNCYRMIVDTAVPAVGMTCVWKGYATRYHEHIKIARIIQPEIGSTSAYWGMLDRPYECTYNVTLRNFPTITGNGEVTNWDSVKNTRWPIQYYYYGLLTENYGDGTHAGEVTSSRTQTFNAADTHDFFDVSVTLDKDDDDKSILYEHIITDDKDTEWRVSNPNWPNLMNQSPENTSINAAAVRSAASATDLCRVGGIATHVTPHQNHMQTATCYQEIPNNDIYPSLGLFATLRKSTNIYQDDKEEDIVIENTRIRKIKPTLSDGFQLLAAPAGAKILWTPVFNWTHVHNGTSTYTDNTHEVKIYFSNGPFTDNCTSTNPIRVKVNGSDTEEDYALTTERKCQVEFTMPSNGIVYVKWVPDETTYFNSDWLVTLDVEKCNNFRYTVDV